jgi:hypothetical protein
VRIPKTGGAAQVLVEDVRFVDYLEVTENKVFFSEEHAVSVVPVQGGSPLCQ